MHSPLINHIMENIQLIEESENSQYAKSLDIAIDKFTSSAMFGDYVAYIKKYMPKTVAKYGVPLSDTELTTTLDQIFPRSQVKPDSKYSASFRKLFGPKTNASPAIVELKMAAPNAFTIPGVYKERKHITIGSVVFGKRPTLRIDGDKNLISDFGKITPLVFYTSGLNKIKLTQQERDAIMLHELGHWQPKTTASTRSNLILQPARVFLVIMNVVMGKYLLINQYPTELASTISAILPFTIALSFITMFAGLSLSRRAEFDADKFANDFGYGLPLVNSLRMMGKQKRVKSAAELEELSSFMDKISPLTDLLSTHPSTYRRSKTILTESSIVDILGSLNPSSIISKLDTFIANQEFLPELALVSK